MRLPGMGVTADLVMKRVIIYIIGVIIGAVGIAQSGLKDTINRLVAERSQLG
jgi:hypothetical protein